MERVVLFTSVLVLVLGYTFKKGNDELRQRRWKPLEYSTLFGVIGGLGPKAMAYFFQEIVDSRTRLFRVMSKGSNPEDRWIRVKQESTAEWTSKQIEFVWNQTKGRDQLLDQDHIPILVAQATTVPPRPKYILGESKIDPLPQMINVASGLESAGATHLAIVCNTAHWFWPDVAKNVGVPVIDMVKLTLERVAKTAKEGKKIGLFATKATLRTEMYQAAARPIGITFVSPLDVDGGHGQERLESANCFLQRT